MAFRGPSGFGAGWARQRACANLSDRLVVRPHGLNKHGAHRAFDAVRDGIPRRVAKVYFKKNGTLQVVFPRTGRSEALFTDLRDEAQRLAHARPGWTFSAHEGGQYFSILNIAPDDSVSAVVDLAVRHLDQN